MTVLVTGVNGYLGLKAAAAALDRGHDVVGIDLRSRNVGRLPADSRFKFYTADITDVGTFLRDIRGADILVHCAALVHGKARGAKAEDYARINVQGTQNVLDFLDSKRLAHIVFLSTVSAYGGSRQGEVPDEAYPVAPCDHYGRSKVEAEERIKRYCEANGIPYTILRLAPVYGKDFLLNLQRRVSLMGGKLFYEVSSGKQRMSLCAVETVVATIAHCLNNPRCFNQVFNVQDESDYSVAEVLRYMREFSRKWVPTIRIPSFLPDLAIWLASAVSPEKGRLLGYKLGKVTRDATYNADKLRRLDVGGRSDMRATLRERT